MTGQSQTRQKPEARSALQTSIHYWNRVSVVNQPDCISSQCIIAKTYHAEEQVLQINGVIFLGNELDKLVHTRLENTKIRYLTSDKTRSDQGPLVGPHFVIGCEDAISEEW